MTLDRKECLELYDNAACSGEVTLFASTSRDAFQVAQTRCNACPVLSLCFRHVNPVEDGFTGTCAGRLYYEGTDVTETPGALPPPVFRLREVDLMMASALIDGSDNVWEGHSDSTVMTVCWGLRKKYTLNRISKVSGLAKDHVARLVYAFDDGAPTDFKDFIASQISDA